MPEKKKVKNEAATSEPMETIPMETVIAQKGIEHVQLKQQVKELNARINAIRPSLEDYLKENGSDVKGSIISVLPYADKDVILKNTLRVSKVLKPEAIDILKELKLTDCIETIEVIREDVLERMWENKLVTDEDVAKIYATADSFAFSVAVKPRHHE